MSVLITSPEVGVEIASASVWGVPLAGKIGGFTEIVPRIFRVGAGGAYVYFSKIETSFGSDKIKYYRQNPNDYTNKTNDIASQYGLQLVYPPAFRGFPAALVPPDVAIALRGNPIYIYAVMPPITPQNQQNQIILHLHDLDLKIYIKPFSANELTVHIEATGAGIGYQMFFTEPIGFPVDRGDAFTFLLGVSYDILYHKGGAVLALTIQVNQKSETKVLPLNSVAEMEGNVTFTGYGAYTFMQPTYVTQELTPYPEPQTLPNVVTPSHRIIIDRFGTLQYLSGVTIPARTNPNIPLIIRRYFVIAVPTIVSSGTWQSVSGVNSISWSNTGGSLSGYNLSIQTSAAVRLTVGSRQWVYKVRKVTRRQTPNDPRMVVDVEFYNPLTTNEHTFPRRFNPYLMRISDFLQVMQASVHLAFNLVTDINTNAIILRDEELDFNSLQDYLDFLKELYGGNAEWFVIGNTVYFQPLSSAPPTLSPIPQDYIVSYEVTVSADEPTVGVFGDNVYVSSQASQRGVSIASGRFPVKRLESYEIVGIYLVGENEFVRLPNGEKAFVRNVSYSIQPFEPPKTQLELEVVDI
jgi:hypothetical protein